MQHCMIVREALVCAQIAAVWPSVLWSSTLLRLVIYKLFTLVTIVNMCILMILQVVAMLCMSMASMGELAETLYIFSTGVNASVKCVNMLTKRQKYLHLANMLLDDKCIPKGKHEIEICAYFDKYSRVVAICCLWIAAIAAVSVALEPLFYIHDNYTLSLRAWYPYDIASRLTFWPTFLHQTYGLLTMSAWNVANDVIAVGFMLKFCSQIQLMSHRLECLPRKIQCHVAANNSTRYLQLERDLVERCVSHHLYILKMIRSFETTFAPNILSQYCLSGFVICMTLYQLTACRSNTVMLVTLSIYLSTMLIEMSLYCYFGNEVTVQSLQIKNAVFKGDWLNMHSRTVKSLLIIMARANAPILITCGPFITLSNAAYMSVLKVSYSAVNVLRQFQ